MILPNLTQKYGFVKSLNNTHRECDSTCVAAPRVKGYDDEQTNSSVYAGRIFPSGDFSIGVVPKKKISATDKQYESDHGKVTRHEVKWQEKGQTQVEGYLRFAPSSPPSPNLVNPAKFTQPKRKPYGEGGITTYGKRMVSSAAVILEREWGRQCTGFGTLTLPPMSAQIESHICADWSRIVNRFFEELRRHQCRHGGDERYVHVTEIQEERWSKRGELGLHIHFLYKARKNAYSKAWIVSADWCRDTWRRILANSLGMSALEIPKPRVELAVVKKSAAGYMGKYLSKGGKFLEAIKEEIEGKGLLPRQWWGLANTLRDDVKKQIIRLDSRMSAQLWSLVSSASCSYFSYTRRVEISSDMFGVRCVGLFGRIVLSEIRNVADYLTHEKYVT
jgi:hypothetical protein